MSKSSRCMEIYVECYLFQKSSKSSVCDRPWRRRYVHARRSESSTRRPSGVQWVSAANWKSWGHRWRRRRGHARLPRASYTRRRTVSPNWPTPTHRCRRRNASLRATSRRCTYVNQPAHHSFHSAVMLHAFISHQCWHHVVVATELGQNAIDVLRPVSTTAALHVASDSER